jgi:DNA-binding GntR family transcriptional regulator
VLRNLAKELNTSPGPVVIALRMLERDGLVRNMPGMGAQVRLWSVGDIMHLYKIRAALEGLAAGLCAEAATASDREALVAANETIKRAFVANDVEAHIAADVTFHQRLVAGAHCEDVARMVEYAAIVQHSMGLFAHSLNVPRLLTAGGRDVHDPIVDAVLDRDSEAAERAARRHVEDSLSNHIEWLEQACGALANGRERQSRLSVI